MSYKYLPRGGLWILNSDSSQQQHDRESGHRTCTDIRISLNDRSVPLHRALPTGLQEACCSQLIPPQTSLVTTSQHWYTPLSERGPGPGWTPGGYLREEANRHSTPADTYSRPREGHMVTVLLPRLVEALGKLLEESMRLVEDGKSQNVDPVIHKAVHSLQ